VTRSDSTAPAVSRRRRKRGLTIEHYLGFGTASKVSLSGRVLKEKGPILSSATDTKWRNLRNTLKRFATAEVPGARILVRYGSAEAIAVTGSDGYFALEIESVDALPAGHWREVTLALLDGRRGGGIAASATAEVLVPPDTARFGVISDIDDTVVTTHVTSPLQMLATVLLSNPHVRLPFEGIAGFYRALHEGAAGNEGNPIFYVSNGPWDFYGLLIEFFKVHGIPVGPLFLREFGPLRYVGRKRQPSQKLFHIERILETYPRLPFVLIGDSGERDPELYAETVKRHPERIRAIYIRSVDKRRERLAAIDALAAAIRSTKTQFVVVPDSHSAAVHAAGEGLIDGAALASIRGDSG
jgi:phosphatidate phosphatase APP1